MRAAVLAPLALATLAAAAQAGSFTICNQADAPISVAAAHRSAPGNADLTALGWLRIAPGACTPIASTRGEWLEVLFAVRRRTQDNWMLVFYTHAAAPPLGARRPGADRPETYRAEVFACVPETDFSTTLRLSNHTLGSCDPGRQMLFNQRAMVVGRFNYTLDLR